MIVDDSTIFRKAEQNIQKKGKKKNDFLLKDPSKYDYKKELSTVHYEEISCIETLSNGNLITGSLDTTLKIWDACSG